MITLECANTGGEGNFRLMGVDTGDRPQELQVNKFYIAIVDIRVWANFIVARTIIVRCFCSRAFVSHKCVTDEWQFINDNSFVTDESSQAEASQLYCPCYNKVCSVMSTIAYLKCGNEPDYYKFYISCTCMYTSSEIMHKYFITVNNYVARNVLQYSASSCLFTISKL